MYLNKWKPLSARNAKRKTEYTAKYIYIHLLYLFCTIFKHLKLPVRSIIFSRYINKKSSIWSFSGFNFSFHPYCLRHTVNSLKNIYCFKTLLYMLDCEYVPIRIFPIYCQYFAIHGKRH